MQSEFASHQLPERVRPVADAFRDGLTDALGDDVVGIYIYGALTFAEAAETAADVDYHVLLRRPLSDTQRRALNDLHERLADQYALGGELDGYYLLIDSARGVQPPPDQRHVGVRDDSWALHRAHILSVHVITLAGPDPSTIYRPPTWEEVDSALQWELSYVRGHLDEYPAYCVLNLCRLIYSYRTRDVVVSKQGTGRWALDQLPNQWQDVINAGLRVYAGTASSPDREILKSRASAFRSFAETQIASTRAPLADAALGLTRGQVRLAEADPRWSTAFERLAASIRGAVGDSAAAIEHVGSTAVPGLVAKPILDVAVSLAPNAETDAVIAQLESRGYEFRGDQGNDGGLLFVLGDGPAHRLAHVHVLRCGDPQWDRYVKVRDLLRSDPAARAAYGALKRRLANDHADDRAAYTAGKSSFLDSLVADKADELSRQSLETSIGSCTVGLATPDDVATVIALRDSAARWMVDRGIEQWVPGELPVSYFERLIAEHAVWLLRHDDQIVGTVSVTWNDPEVWGERDVGQAGYIRGLVIDRRLAGKGLGSDLLDWAERHISASGRQQARLDCVRTNRELRDYYERAGYHNVGYKDFPDIDWAREVALYEKSLA